MIRVTITNLFQDYKSFIEFSQDFVEVVILIVIASIERIQKLLIGWFAVEFGILVISRPTLPVPHFIKEAAEEEDDQQENYVGGVEQAVVYWTNILRSHSRDVHVVESGDPKEWLVVLKQPVVYLSVSWIFNSTFLKTLYCSLSCVGSVWQVV